MPSSISILQVLSVSTSLLAAGGIASLTFFSVPSFLALPASRSLPQTRWLFSRGSHVFPTAAIFSSAGYASLAFLALPAGARTLSHLLQSLSRRGNAGINGYIAAATLCLSIGPVTRLMLPINFELIRMNEEKGGTRSEKTAKVQWNNSDGQKNRTAEEASEFSDLSGPQNATNAKSTREEDEKVRDLLVKFGRLNLVRAVLLGAGGIVGLMAALM